ncbi:peptidase inhibitor family I36 protein [Streptomyces sp. NPDC059063]|uniref:peptidase inhibitor family I36 protein n=1 Tax=unclassified Streptomyces TaxID=2593676 RepID=UPI0036A8D2DD
MSPTTRTVRSIGAILAASCMGALLVAAPAGAEGEVSSRCARKHFCFWAKTDYKGRSGSGKIGRCVTLPFKAGSIKNRTSARVYYFEGYNCVGLNKGISPGKSKAHTEFWVRSYR